jgi:diguanylate cyclase (GGDEF)-like protein
MKILKQKRLKWMVIGVGLSFLGPLGEWVLLSSFAGSGKDSLFLTYLYTEISALLAFGFFGFMLGTYADRAENLAMTDRLTGLYNRHFIMNRLSEMFNLQHRYHEYFSLIMLDLDHFKQVNDNHGHPVGDQTIKAVAATMSAQLRDTDSPCRFGGEEFLILCPHTNLEEAYHLAERIRLQVMKLGADELGFSGSQTISAGVYEVAGNQQLSESEVMTRVDKALYSAKEAGRNQVVRG